MQHGSFINQTSGTSATTVPTVGMGATNMLWTDRHAYTIVAVSASGKTIKVQRDTATRTDGNGMSESQSYTYKPDPTAMVVTVRLTKRGWRSKSHGKFVLGTRMEYHDFSF